MLSVLDQEALRRDVLPISVADYHRLGELGILHADVELLDSVIVRKMPKSPLHEFLVSRLLDWIQGFLRDREEAPVLVRKESPLAIPPSEPEPDLAVVDGTVESYQTFHPATARLVIEVAVSSLERDLWKVKPYAQAAVAEYWIIDADRPSIHQLTQPDPDRLAFRSRVILESEQEVRCQSLPGFAFRCADLFPEPPLHS